MNASQAALSLFRLCLRLRGRCCSTAACDTMIASQPPLSLCRLWPTSCWHYCWMLASGRRCGCQAGCSSACSACRPACSLYGGKELGDDPDGRCRAPRGTCRGLAPAALWMLSWSWLACRMGPTGQLLHAPSATQVPGRTVWQAAMHVFNEACDWSRLACRTSQAAGGLLTLTPFRHPANRCMLLLAPMSCLCNGVVLSVRTAWSARLA